MTHPCAVDGCEILPEGHRVFCEPHWAKVPLVVRYALQKVWTWDHPLEAYRTAIAAALNAMKP